MTQAPLHATALAQPNIALVKYWGKRDARLNLPAAGSLSITLDTLHTRTSVVFDAALDADEALLNGRSDVAQTRKVSAFLDLFRTRADIHLYARVASANDFPTGAGLASSASGFAALAVAANHALDTRLTASELSMFARRGSGSAARSIFGGFVAMAAGQREDGADAFASPLLDSGAWPLEVLVAITSHDKKTVSSRDGMQHTRLTSPYYTQWIATADTDLSTARDAVRARDFAKLADISEASCLAMHAVMLSARPGLLYWNAASVACMHCVRALRQAGAAVFFTIDAGPQVKAVCLPGDTPRVAEALRNLAGVEEVLVSGLGEGARIVAGAA